MNFLNCPTQPTINRYKSYEQYTRARRLRNRAQFIKHLHSEGFTVDEIKNVFPRMSKEQVKKTIDS